MDVTHAMNELRRLERARNQFSKAIALVSARIDTQEIDELVDSTLQSLDQAVYIMARRLEDVLSDSAVRPEWP